MNKIYVFASFFSSFSLCFSNPVDASPSALWGFHGEAWKVGKRLPDFSYAGYHRGEAPIPDRIAEADVTAFGAVGNGITDDGAAFQRAIDASPGKVIFIPPGTYVINQQLRIIGQSGTVLRGAGRDLTTLLFKKSLEQMFPGTNTPYPGSIFGLYHAYGGVIFLGARDDKKAVFPQSVIGKVTAAAAQGSTSLTVSKGAALQVGKDYLISMFSSDSHNKTLPTYLLEGDLTSFTMSPVPIQANFGFRVTSISGNQVTIDRPLPFEIKTSWTSNILPAKMSSEECGIEDLTVAFARSRYVAPEPGYNGILFQYTRNSFIRRLRIKNSDNAIILRGCYNNTVDDIILESNASPQTLSGHFGLFFHVSFDNLAQNIAFKSTFGHGLSVYNSHLNVCKNSSNVGKASLSIDHRGSIPTRNLFSNITAQIPFGTSGDSGTEGVKAGQYETYWNVRGVTSNWPSIFGKATKNIVGATGKS
nr:hypothetical protein [Simkaniaceae bacterium]